MPSQKTSSVSYSLSRSLFHEETTLMSFNLFIFRSYRDVLKYYMKSEKADLDGLENSPYRGTSGELNVGYPFR